MAALLQRHRSTQVNKTLQDVLSSPALVYYVCISTGSCPLKEFCQVQGSLCVQVLHSPILAALLHDTRAAAKSQTLWRPTRNGITELLRRAPQFGWSAITFGIGSHSSFRLLISADKRSLTCISKQYRCNVKYIRACCHCNKTRAPIANPPTSAQLEGTPIIPLSYIRVREVLCECGEGQTHRRPTSVYISPRLCLTL